MAIIPETVTPKQLAEQTGWSERFVRETARQLNACLGRGRGMRLTQGDVLKIMEHKRCPSEFSNVREAISGSTPAQLSDIDYAARLAQRTAKMPKELRPRQKPESGNVVLIGKR